jgi:hypothetical protein
VKALKRVGVAGDPADPCNTLILVSGSKPGRRMIAEFIMRVIPEPQRGY